MKNSVLISYQTESALNKTTRFKICCSYVMVHNNLLIITTVYYNSLYVYKLIYKHVVGQNSSDTKSFKKPTTALRWCKCVGYLLLKNNKIILVYPFVHILHDHDKNLCLLLQIQLFVCCPWQIFCLYTPNQKWDCL